MKEIFVKYLVSEEKEPCAHCGKAQPEKGKTVCSKCSKELEEFRNKTSDKEDVTE